MAYVITETCVDFQERACVDECPVDCIYEGPRSNYINSQECIDCGACQLACPVEAIYYVADVVPSRAPHIGAAHEVFELAGNPSPGGAERFGRLVQDSSYVAALPPRETLA